MSDEPKTITQKLFEIQQKLKVPKDQYNKFANYPFKRAVDIIEKVKPLLADQKVTLNFKYAPIVVGDWVFIKATVELICIESEKGISCQAVAREPENKKGFDQSQITGASSSYALKYALGCLFCLDDSKDDPDTKDNSKAHQDEFDKAYKKVQSFYSNMTDKDRERAKTAKNQKDIQALNQLIAYYGAINGSK